MDVATTGNCNYNCNCNCNCELLEDREPCWQRQVRPARRQDLRAEYTNPEQACEFDQDQLNGSDGNKDKPHKLQNTGS
jgi:hypothetical protein